MFCSSQHRPTLKDREGCKAWHPVGFSIYLLNEWKVRTPNHRDEGHFFASLSFWSLRVEASLKNKLPDLGADEAIKIELWFLLLGNYLVHLKCCVNCRKVPVLETSLIVPFYVAVPMPCSAVTILTSGPHWVRNVGTLPGDLVVVKWSYHYTVYGSATSYIGEAAWLFVLVPRMLLMAQHNSIVLWLPLRKKKYAIVHSSYIFFVMWL